MADDRPQVWGVGTLDLGRSWWGLSDWIAEELEKQGYTRAYLKDQNYPGLATDGNQSQMKIVALVKSDVTVYLELKTIEGHFHLVSIVIGSVYDRREAYNAVRELYDQAIRTLRITHQ